MKDGVLFKHDADVIWSYSSILCQTEPDESLTHTFDIPVPEYGELFWWRCGGRTVGFLGLWPQWSASLSPFFSHRCLAPTAPVQTNDCQPLATVNTGYCQYWNANAQTFTPDHNYTAKTLYLMLNQWDVILKGPYRVKITLAGTPCWSESVLFQYDGQATDLPLPGVQAWTAYDLGELPLVSGIMCRIVVHTIPPWYYYWGGRWIREDSVAALCWWRKATGNPYPRGRMCNGCNFKTSSGSWAYTDTDDMTFCIYAKP
jgi:hypothetical protein